MRKFFEYQRFSQRVSVGRGFKYPRFVAHAVIGLSVVSLVPMLGLSSHNVQSDAIASRTGESVTIGHTVYAQTPAQETGISSQDIDLYAEAVLNIEQIRLVTFEKIQSLMATDSLPSMQCDQEETVIDLPADVQTLVVDFCQDSIDIVQSASLSVSQFNEMTETVQQDSALYDAVQESLTRLQTIPADTENNVDTETPTEL